MVFSNLEFQNKELEEQFQKQQQKNVLKSGFKYLVILLLGKCVVVIDNLIHQQYILILIVFPLIITEIVMLHLLKIKKLQSGQLLYLNNLLVLSGIAVSYFNIILGDEYGLHPAQLSVMLDIGQQFITFVNFGQSYRQNSITFFIYIANRVYNQSIVSYTNYSITYILYGSLYVIAQYQMQKQRRKLFLKSQRNQLLEKLIEDFVDEKVCIIEKDEDNVKFIPIIMNERLKRCFTDDINQALKSIQVTVRRESLSNYLYKTLQNSETIICQIKSHVYEVTYQRFILKKCQIFVKIKEICNKSNNIGFYQELYKIQQLSLIKYSKSSYQVKQVFYQMQEKIFVFWFQKYYLTYKILIETLPFEQLKELLIARKFKIISFESEATEILTDKQLIIILIRSVERLLSDRFIKIQQIESGIQMIVYGVMNYPINKQKQLVGFISKILFHIGIVSCQIEQSDNTSGNITIQLFDIQSEYVSFKQGNY